MKKFSFKKILIFFTLLIMVLPKLYFFVTEASFSYIISSHKISESLYEDKNLLGNDPIVYKNMIPVFYDLNNKIWKKANIRKPWYNYEENWWANVVVPKEEYRDKYLKMGVNEPINIDEIYGFFVWIPRFEYKLFNVNNEIVSPQVIDVNIVSVDSKKTEIKNGEYYTHPAFTANYKDGSTYELKGFWISKFEPSLNNKKVYFMPNKKPLVNLNMADMWIYASNVNDDYGLNVDSRIINNMEWGAIAYFSFSKYGKPGNSDFESNDKRIYINNSMGDENWNNLITGCSAGNAIFGGVQNCSYRYDVPKKGTGASSTGNIYGIYDLTGGAWECVMGLISSDDIPSKIGGYKGDPPTETRYYTLYESGAMTNTSRGKIGDATRETKESYEEHASWYMNNSYFATSAFPWIKRGGSFRGGYYSGLFDYGITDALPRGDKTFRVILSEY